MASDQYVFGSGPINLPAAQLCTLALNTAASRRAAIKAVRVSFSAASSINVLCHLSRISNTPVGSAIPANYGANRYDPSMDAASTTASCASTANPGAWTTPPTESSILWEMDLPSSGGWVEYPTDGQEWIVAASAWIGVFMTAAATGVVAYTQLVFAE